ncbi:pleckstrin homology domain-containing family J member 1-like isoform X1 [Penaeus chinensis]|uniref:pleckstrin homology domain-containing family J member 1-like isoform X1 n=1 Tax=Penaeus chinensis TaxID=139456 RepID=UPI001FB68343|nr:pleckstrin homology domain-containing family J member 1-like isoform X1 [Penaeus chinensis]XP_047498860.1 pleckstrin homology domain-containing family J member 1-like isoform X1 [Penaeus chinensis]
MRFNEEELAEFALSPGDHEGRLTHKGPPRTLYDTSYKERWFKLKANFFFYYRLNEFGGVEKNEPTGVFVLENIEVQREEEANLPFGFAIRWKDDPDKKQLFFAHSEASVQSWIGKILHASYDHLRAQLIMLRVQIRRKTGKDPLEHYGTPLPQRAAMALLPLQSVSLQDLFISPSSAYSVSSAPASPSMSHSLTPMVPESSSRFNRLAKSPDLRLRIPKSPSLRVPTRSAPVPPPRRAKKVEPENGILRDQPNIRGIGRTRASFKCHLVEECAKEPPPSLLD